MANNIFDVIVIGSGAAGFSAAETVLNRGLSVCVIEKDAWGGECPNFACIPAKALIKSAKMYHLAKNDLSKYGVHASTVTYNFKEMMNRKSAIVDAITGKGKRLVETSKKIGIKTIHGEASFIDSSTVKVSEKKYKAKGFIIATGAIDFIPPIGGIESIKILNYRDITKLSSPPKSLLIVGGGPVGCEYATFFAMLGTKVTILQLAPVVLNREDYEISVIAQKKLEELGVNVLAGSKALSFEKRGRQVFAVYQQGRQARKNITVDSVFIAAGKRAAVEGLNLKNAGVKLDKKGRIKLQETLQTSEKNIFVAGDVSGGMLFTHTAHEEGVIAGMNILNKKASLKKRDMRVVPRVTFVAPEVASVGMTEKEAIKANKLVSVAKFPVGALGRAVTEGKRVGLLKIVVEKKTKKILGAHMIGENAGEVIHELALAMHANIKTSAVASMIHAFPTYSESIPAALGSIEL